MSNWAGLWMKERTREGNKDTKKARVCSDGGSVWLTGGDSQGTEGVMEWVDVTCRCTHKQKHTQSSPQTATSNLSACRRWRGKASDIELRHSGAIRYSPCVLMYMNCMTLFLWSANPIKRPKLTCSQTLNHFWIPWLVCEKQTSDLLLTLLYRNSTTFPCTVLNPKFFHKVLVVSWLHFHHGSRVSSMLH